MKFSPRNFFTEQICWALSPVPIKSFLSTSKGGYSSELFSDIWLASKKPFMICSREYNCMTNEKIESIFCAAFHWEQVKRARGSILPCYFFCVSYNVSIRFQKTYSATYFRRSKTGKMFEVFCIPDRMRHTIFFLFLIL